MEQLTLTKKLSRWEQQRVYVAVACGCLEMIHKMIPGPDHSKHKRMVRDARQMILDGIATQLPGIPKHHLATFHLYCTAADDVLKTLAEDPAQHVHILLNLTAYCLHKLPMRDRHWNKFNPLFDLLPDANRSTDTTAGDNIFGLIDAEVENLTAQTKGIF